MHALLAAAAAVLGLCIGSFLTVVTSRVPAGTSIVRPGSACPGCGHALAWYDNVPVVSWLALRGRCRACHMTIPPRYPLLELSTGVAFAVIAAFVRPAAFAPAAVFAAGAIATGVVWHGHRRIEWRIVAVTLALVLISLTAAEVITSRR